MPRPSIRTLLARGIRMRCPRCGGGALFSRWITVREACEHCGLVFQRDSGDTWMFIVITDRIPMLFGIAALYFGYRSTNLWWTALFLVLLAVPMIATMRQRIGVALALNYLSRELLPD